MRNLIFHSCLLDNLNNLSKPCRTAEFKIQILKEDGLSLNPRMRKACSFDVKTHCDTVEDSSVVKCLQDHEEELTVACKHNVQRENVKQGMSLSFNKDLTMTCSSTLEEFVDAKKPKCDSKKAFAFRTQGVTRGDLPGGKQGTIQMTRRKTKSKLINN